MQSISVMMSRQWRLIAITLIGTTFWMLCPRGGCAFASGGDSGRGLLDMSLEELLNVEVSSVSKKVEKQADAAAAVYVLTTEDIRRSGCTSLPDVLRTVPGLQVAQVNAHSWAVTSRGFNGEYAAKLLVLIDGRSVYTPLFSGVYWNVTDLPSDDIEQIEVVRGPGATLWGANAVNGVINIITKNSKETQGAKLSAAGGAQERGLISGWFGRRLGTTGSFRVSAKYHNRGPAAMASGMPATPDGWDLFRGAYRVDWTPTKRDALCVTGDLYQGKFDMAYNAPRFETPYVKLLLKDSPMSGCSILSRWTRQYSEQSQSALQVYYDYYQRNELVINERRRTLDANYQHSFSPAAAIGVVAGFGYRRTTDAVDSTDFAWLTTQRRVDNVFSAFVQGDYSWRNLARVTVGTKIEHNDYSGLEVQPNVRVMVHPARKHTLWAAISRALRTPSRADHTVRIVASVIPPLSLSNPGALPLAVIWSGDASMVSEKLIAYETGYRLMPTDQISLDLTAFYNDYKDLRAGTFQTPEPVGLPPKYVALPVTANNKLAGRTIGFESAFDWMPARTVRFTGSYSYFDLQTYAGSDLLQGVLNGGEGSAPRHQISLRSRLDPTDRIECDLGVRYVSQLSAFGIGSYTELDGRIGYDLMSSLALTVVGRNLLAPRHVEYPASLGGVASTAERTIYGAISVKLP